MMDPYIRYTFDYYRHASQVKAVPVIMASSLSTSLATPAPKNVWVIASVLVNPDDKSSGPEATQTQVQTFLDSHGKSYCAERPRPEGASVQVWQLRRCVNLCRDPVQCWRSLNHAVTNSASQTSPALRLQHLNARDLARKA